MVSADGVVLSVAILGFAHGVEPGHGWPVAVAYALDQSNKWLYGLVASLLLGIGHLISSLAVVALYFLLRATTAFGMPWWINYVAGAILILLGVREIRSGHGSHGGTHADRGDADSCGREHADTHGGGHTHSHGLSAADERGGAHDRHGHAHGADGGHHARTFGTGPTADRGLLGIAGFAFALGFVHEEEFQIIALCVGSGQCLTLMVIYALAVLVGIVGLTMALVAGYYRFEERVERVAPYLPHISGVVLIVMGLGFVLGVF